MDWKDLTMWPDEDLQYEICIELCNHKFFRTFFLVSDKLRGLLDEFKRREDILHEQLNLNGN